MFLAFFNHDYLVKKNLLQKFSHHVNIVLNGNNIIKNKNLFPLKYWKVTLIRGWNVCQSGSAWRWVNECCVFRLEVTQGKGCLLKIGNFQSGFLIAKISSWHWTPFCFPSWFVLFSYSKKPKASQPARQPTSKSVHSKTSTWYIGNSHWDEKFPTLWASSLSVSVSVAHYSYYPRGPIMGKGDSPNSRKEWDSGFSVPGLFKLDHLQPVEPILFW